MGVVQWRPMTFPDHRFADRVQDLIFIAEQCGQPALAAKLREIEEWCRGSGVPLNAVAGSASLGGGNLS